MEFDLSPNSQPDTETNVSSFSFADKSPGSTFSGNQESDTAQQKATKDRCLTIIRELNKKGKVSYDVEENSDTGYFFADNLKAEEAEEAVKLLAELTKKVKVTFGVIDENSDTVSFIAEKAQTTRSSKTC